MNQNNLDNILRRTIKNIVELEHRPFSYVDVVEKGVKITKTNFGIKFQNYSKLEKLKLYTILLRVLYNQRCRCIKNVTRDHTAVTSSHPHNRHNYRQLCNDPVYRIIQNLPLGKRSLHDIRLKFFVQEFGLP